MQRRTFIVSLTGGLVAPSVSVFAQATKVARIGLLGALTNEAVADRVAAFRMGMRELGYVEGQNLIIEERWAEGKLDRMPALAAELVRMNVDVILSGGPAATAPAKAATSTIPIVMGMDNDPVASGFVKSLAKPGGNITGVTTSVPSLSAKQLEIVKEILPQLTRLMVIGGGDEPGRALQLVEAERAAKRLGVRLVYVDVVHEKDIARAFGVAAQERAGALLALTGPIITFFGKAIAEEALRNRMPSAFAHREAVRDGGLVSYGVHFPELFRRAAGYVDRILKGAKPSEMAIEQPTRFELMVNLQTARALALPIPQSILLRADQIVQ